MARQSKLTPALIAEAEALIKAGNFNDVVADILKIDRATWYRWLKNGKEGRTEVEAEFYDTIKTAEGKAEALAVGGILMAGKRNWTAYAWYLERKYPGRWGRNAPPSGDDDPLDRLVSAIMTMCRAPDEEQGGGGNVRTRAT